MGKYWDVLEPDHALVHGRLNAEQMKRILVNIASVVGGEVAIRVANFTASLIIARRYGPVWLGIYATVLAFATIVGSLADNGLSISTIPEIRQRLHQIDRVVTSLYAAKTALFLLAVSGVAAIVYWEHFTTAKLVIGVLLFSKVLLNSYGALNFGVLKSLEKMSAIGIVQGLHACSVLCCVAMVYRLGCGFTTLLLFLLLAQCAELLSSGSILFALKIRPTRVTVSECLRLIAVSTPVGVSTLLAGIIQRIDVLAISAVGVVKQVGEFASADNGLIVIYLGAALFGNVLLADMATMKPHYLDRYVVRWRRLILGATVPVAIVAALLARWLILLIYGPSFSPAGKPASIMALTLPFIVLNALYFNRAIALRLHRAYLTIWIITAMIAALASCTLAYAFGSTGVAVAILIREALMLFLFLTSTRSPSTATLSVEHSQSYSSV